MLWSGIVSGERMVLLDHQKKRGIWMLFVTLFEWESWHHRREPSSFPSAALQISLPLGREPY